jgi:hypothetical protein
MLSTTLNELVGPRSAPMIESTSAQCEQHTQSYTRAVHYGGNCYLVTREMADIFIRQAGRLIDADSTELLPLRHQGGLDLLLIGPASPFAVAEIDLDDSGRAGAREPDATIALIPSIVRDELKGA